MVGSPDPGDFEFAYQIERIDIGQTSVTVAYLDPGEAQSEHVTEFRIIEGSVDNDEIFALTKAVIQQACVLVDTMRTIKRGPAERKPARIRD